MRAGKFLMVIALLALVSCKQDDIFNKIASETAPLPPLIEGAPTNMVVFEREYPDRAEPIIYVASGRLHWYAKAPDTGEPQWDSGEHPIPQPAGKIISLAVAGDRLYALCRDGNSINAKLRYIKSRYAPDEEWKTIQADDYPSIQSIYADPQTTRLFAGAGRSSYTILYLDNTTDELKPLKDDTSIFSGTVCRQNGEGETIYYLSTRGGIFQISETALAENNRDALQQLNDNSDEELDRKDNRMFMSVIKLKNDTIIAVERDGGALYEIHDGFFSRMRYASANNDLISIDKYATTAHALWEDPERNLELLVIGIQGGLYSTTTSSHTYGYVEFELSAGGNAIVSRRDSGSLLSVHDNARYTASLGKHPINHLLQAPAAIDPIITFFASTQTAGLWSYRDRPDNDGWQWNAEK